ncbi:MAG: 5'-nucleotidase C-terminal domain-containing protein [Pseudomonadota bacterium]
MSSDTLRILATSDVHMNLTGFDYLRDVATTGLGLARLAALVRDARAAGPSLLLDNGDLLQGTVLGDLAAGPAGNPLPRILGQMGYDAMGLDNHDMDFGLDAFAEFAHAAPVPLVCSNFDLPGTVRTAMVTRDLPSGTVQIGITSVLPPQTVIWNARHLGGLPAPRPPVEAARAAVEALRAQGADIVVMLGHTGLAEDGPAAEEDFGRMLARVPGLDALVLGHTHRRLPGPDHEGMTDVDAAAGRVAGVPAVMPGFGGACLGQIDLALERRNGTWAVTGARTALLRAADAAGDDGAVAALVAPLHMQARALMARQVGTADQPLHSYFAALGRDPGQAMCARAMQQAITPQLHAAGLGALPLVAAVAPNAVGGRAGPRNYLLAQAGPLLRRHLALIAPYPNEVWALRVTGAELCAWLERALGYYADGLGSGGPKPLVNWRHPVFNFDALFGLEAVYDPLRPFGARVAQLLHRGAPVRAGEEFALVTTSYRAAGGGRFPGTGLDRVVARAPGTLIDALEKAVTGEPVRALGDAPFRLDAGGTTRVHLDTAPGAAEHLDQIAPHAPEVAGTLESGFLRLSLTI